ncbi:sensor histidine kinase [Scatolibacter rhodanostii]|uniref:sensor histidine kinase n=1 Tax=Scatolibacter rhodanostii TaxID=2014781 RepID=UPI000C06CA1C|nr:HAMP domain-containing sensor histidine kinase [Scatolibacter rhodanostii]
MGLNKNKKLRIFFVQYLFALLAGFLIIIMTVTALFFISLKTGFTISVSDVESSIESRKDIIASAESVTPDLIPNLCKYAVVDYNGNFISGNLTEIQTDEAWNSIKEGRFFSKEATNPFPISLEFSCYFPIERTGEWCILEYSSLTQFSPMLLREHLPAPEITAAWTIAVAFIFEIFLLSRFYGKKISLKLLPLRNATEKIRAKDLNFEIQYSGIEEIDSALKSLNSLKVDLKRSLETQWEIEQSRKTQMSFLAHDLKTPLTVIRGNAEMLDDTEQTEEQKECTLYIRKNTDQIEQYIQMLIDLSKVEGGFPLRLKSIATKAFLNSLYTQIHALLSVKHIHLETNETDLPDTLCLDISQMSRAILNIVSNAVDYCPEQGKIIFSTFYDKKTIHFQISDTGKGFSPMDLKKARNQFYQADSSRNSKFHYGMGLFIADSIVKQHGGVLSLGNVSAAGGAKVVIGLPV